MSEKNAKKERKLEVMAGEADAMETAKEMARSISKMYEDRDSKALSAKEHLVAQLDVTTKKYLTANGVMSALDMVREVCGNGHMDLSDEIEIAKTTANMMSITAGNMMLVAKNMEPEQMDMLCEGFYDVDFANNDKPASEMIYELMVLQLCQNVGPSAEDIVDFIKHADQEIEKARENLRTYCADNGLDFDEVCAGDTEE